MCFIQISYMLIQRLLTKSSCQKKMLKKDWFLNKAYFVSPSHLPGNLGKFCLGKLDFKRDHSILSIQSVDFLVNTFTLPCVTSAPEVIHQRYFSNKLDKRHCITDSSIINLYLILRLELTPIIALSNL